MTDNLSIAEHDEKNNFMTHLKKLVLLEFMLVSDAIAVAVVFS